MSNNYTTGKYIDYDTGRSRWAVLCSKTGTWYFADAYGLDAAKRLAKKLNAGIEGGGQP